MSHKLYTPLGQGAKRALEHQASHNENGEEYGESHFGGFGDYMRRKKLKLQNQDEEIRQQISNEPPLFKGMVIHINGYTKPPREDLHHLIVKYGGVYKQYLEGKSFVTHIIASNLTPKKRVEFERYKVVRPDWIVDCVKAGKTLPWNNYRLITQGSQSTIGISQQVFPDGYRAVSSREEKVVLGGGGLRNASQESSSYPTPPEMKSLDSVEGALDVREEDLDALGGNMLVDEARGEEDLAATVSPEKHAESMVNDDFDIPSTLSSIQISSPPGSQKPRLPPPLFTEASPSIHLPQPETSIPNDPAAEHLEPTRERSPHDESDFIPQIPASPKTIPKEDIAAISAAHNATILANPSLRPHTVVDPSFLKSYFDQSRLHHLSAWKADLKTQMQQLTSQYPARPKRPSLDRWIMHVDFDCFFCSVSLLSRPELREKPVCVGHGGAGSGEIASCNYPARKFGIHNGMFMGRALELCKDLVCLPYDFPAYESASRDFYEILLSVRADATQAVSVDEALLDVSSICTEALTPEDLAQSIRDRVRERTGCDVSIGIGKNILLAKLALRKAKPAGQYLLTSEAAQEFMKDLDVHDLPGVGWKLSEKLEGMMGIKTVGQVRKKSLNGLKEKLGPKTGEKLYEFARGIDHTEVGEIVQRKSVSVEWGVRFETVEQVDTFMLSLATELSSRLIKEGFIGKHLSLKVMRRAADAPLDAPKHLGHGLCDSFNRSIQIGVPTNDAETLGKEAIIMIKSMRIPAGELRGIGLQMGKLERPLKNDGQKKLVFTNPPSAEMESKLPTEQPFGEVPKSSVQPATDIPSPHPKPPQKPVSTTPQTPIKATQFIAPTQIDPVVLANLPDDIRARIVSRKPKPIQSSQIDNDVFQELPASIQAELLEQYGKKPKPKLTPKKKIPSPRKSTATLSMAGQSKLPVTTTGGLDPDVLAELPSTIREEVISEANREQARARAAKERHLAWAAEREVRDRKVNRTVTIPEPAPKPTFQKLSELPDLRDLISKWFEEFKEEGPADEDVELLGTYLKKVVLIEKDLRKAESVVRWFVLCCHFVKGPNLDEWWAAGQKLGVHVNQACSQRGIAKVNFDTRSQ